MNEKLADEIKFYSEDEDILNAINNIGSEIFVHLNELSQSYYSGKSNVPFSTIKAIRFIEEQEYFSADVDEGIDRFDEVNVKCEKVNEEGLSICKVVKSSDETRVHSVIAVPTDIAKLFALGGVLASKHGLSYVKKIEIDL